MKVHKVMVFIFVLCVPWDTRRVASETIESKLSSIQHTMAQMQSEIQAINRQNEQLREELQTLTSKNDVALFLISSAMNAQNIFLSCTMYPSYPSGKYMIQPTRHDAPFSGYCDQTVFGGGWLVVQRRYNGAVDFLRHWSEYRDGFGDVDGEFWLGIERLYRLTSARTHELLFELKDFYGEYSYARYDSFKIGSEGENYVLKELGKFTGTAHNAFNYARGKTFSKVDRDTDTWPEGNCAASYKGAWWYGYCADSNLNGPRSNNNGPQSMYWSTVDYKSYAYTRMMIRVV